MTRGGWGEGTLTPLEAGKWKLRLPPYLGRGQVTFRARNKTAARKEQRRILDQRYAEQFGPKAGAKVTFAEMCDWTLDHHPTGDANTINKMRWSLTHARERFGDRPVDELAHDDIERFRKHLVDGDKNNKGKSPATVHGYMQVLAQVLNQAVKRGLIAESPARHVKNPAARPTAVFPFETVAEVEQLAAEMDARWQLLPVLACGTGLRPEEWLALERADIRDGKIFVNKRWVRGEVKQGTKNGTPERMVPLHPWVAEALARHPVRIDSRLVLPGNNGGYANLDWVRRYVWQPALKASGVKPRRVKDMRHTFATWQLTGNCNVWHLSKVMGTAVEQLERTYGRWIPGSEQVVLSAMDLFLAERQEEAK